LTLTFLKTYLVLHCLLQREWIGKVNGDKKPSAFHDFSRYYHTLNLGTSQWRNLEKRSSGKFCKIYACCKES